jgi:hypothetical protein
VSNGNWRSGGDNTIQLAGDWFAFDTELECWSVSADIGGIFAAFGLANTVPGFDSLNFSGNEAGASANARLSIPFGGGTEE